MSHSTEIPMPRRPKSESRSSARIRPKFSIRNQQLQFLVSCLILTLLISLLILYKYDILSSPKWTSSSNIRIVDSHLIRRRLTDELVEDVNRPYIVVFYSESCLGCKRIRTPYYQLAKQFNDINFYAVPVSLKENSDLVSDFDLSFVPALFVVTKDSDDVHKILYDGKPIYNQIKPFIEKHIGHITTTKQVQDEEKIMSHKLEQVESWEK